MAVNGETNYKAVRNNCICAFRRHDPFPLVPSNIKIPTIVLVQGIIGKSVRQFTLALLRFLGTLQLKAVLVLWVAHGLLFAKRNLLVNMYKYKKDEIDADPYLNTFIVQFQACHNSLMEDFSGFSCSINVADILAFHVPLFVVD